MKSFRNVMRIMFGMSLLTSIAFLALGIFIIVKPDTTLEIIANIIGVFIIVAGLGGVFSYFKNKENGGIFTLTYGIVSLVAGCVLILNPQAVIKVLPFILGIFFCIGGCVKLQYAIDLKQYKASKWYGTLIIAIVTIFCGILFIVNPFEGAKTIMRVTGIVITIYAALDIVNYCVIRQEVKVMDDVFKDSYKENKNIKVIDMKEE